MRQADKNVVEKNLAHISSNTRILNETKHPFSQWNKSEFQIDGLTFNSAEQYMMYGKAKLFDDNKIADKIMASKNVREQKSLGREVNNFDLEIWTENAIDIV